MKTIKKLLRSLFIHWKAHNLIFHGAIPLERGAFRLKCFQVNNLTWTSNDPLSDIIMLDTDELVFRKDGLLFTIRRRQRND